MTITAVIITHNEERNIARCLLSLQDVADEVVVVDSGSTDNTESICRNARVVFEHHDWEGFAKQKNYANSLATKEWILSIDADEALSDELRESIMALKSSVSDTNVAYSFNRITNYCGHWIRHCGWYPDRCCRLWSKDIAHWDGIVHEELRFDQPVTFKPLAGHLLHYSYYSVADHASRLAKYASLGAEQYYADGKRCTLASIILRPAWTFFRNYILKGGILDGWAGFVVCRMSAMYTLTKYATLYKMSKEPQQPPSTP